MSAYCSLSSLTTTSSYLFQLQLLSLIKTLRLQKPASYPQRAGHTGLNFSPVLLKR